MKKGINKIMSVVSIILCITLLSSISTQVLAETIGKNSDETPSNPNFSNIGDGTEVGNIVSEITENRDKYTKHFRLDDGTFMAVNYVVPVHYKTKSGKWVEYDNSLVKENVETSSNEDETKYSNKKSNIDVDISTNSKEDELVSLNTSKGNISWKYVDSNNSKAKVVNENEKLEGNQKFTTLHNLSSEVNYNNIYDNIDLQCFILSTGVKENIILKNAKANNEFQIQYDIQDLKAKQVDEQTINLIKDGKVAYTITAPYICDANGEQSSKVSLKIDRIQDNKLYVNLVADKNFLNNANTKYPVIIDPEVIAINASTTETAQVNSSKENSVEGQQTHFYLGKDANNAEYSALIKSKNIDSDLLNKNIVSAKVSIYPLDTMSNMEIEAYPIKSDWSNSNVTHKNASYDENEIIDYATTESGNTNPVTFDITKVYKRWVDGSLKNNGIYLKSNGSVTDFGGYFCYLKDKLPQFQIIYKDYTGSENNLSSHTVTCGQKADASICDYTGGLIFKQSLYEEKGERMPYSIYQTYHSARKDVLGLAGYGHHMSFEKSVKKTDKYYVYTDSDAVDHYFKIVDGETELNDEDDLGYTLKVQNNKLTIESDRVEVYDIPNNNDVSYIKSETDPDNSKNTITYTYDSSGYLSEITSTLHKYHVYYNVVTDSDGSTRRCYSKITVDSDDAAYFIYYSGCTLPYGIKFIDNKWTTFEYSNNYLSVVKYHFNDDINSENGMKMQFTYSNGKVTKAAEYGYNISTGSYEEGNYLKMVYGTHESSNDKYNKGYNTTTFIDRNGRSETYTFDEYGNTITKLNEYGYIEEGEGGSGLSAMGGSDSYTRNYIDESSHFDSLGGNHYYKKSNESIKTENSSGGTASVDTGIYYFGGNSLKITHNAKSTNQFYTSINHDMNISDYNLSAGDTVTLSGYVYIDKALKAGTRDGQKGAMLKLKTFDPSGSVISDDNSIALLETTTASKWQRISLTVTLPKNTSKIRFYCALRNASGSVWFDCLQLEKGKVMNDYNALSYSDFGANNWKSEQNKWYNQSGDIVTENTIKGSGGEPAPTVDTTVEETTDSTAQTYTSIETETEPYGNIEKTDGNKKIYQQGFVTRKYKRTYESTTENATDDNDTTDDNTESDNNSLKDKHIYQSVNVNRANVVFNISGTAKANSVPLTTDNRTFGIALKINYADNTTEDHYQEYNAYTSAEQSVTLSVTPEEANKIIKTVDFAFVYGYNKNIMEVKNAMLNFAENLVFEKKDGNSDDSTNNSAEPVDESVVSETLDTSKDYMENSVEYDSTENYITKETDDAGNTTEYSYDKNGNQTSVKDGKGNVTSYGYDIQGNTTSISNGNSSNTYIFNNQNQLSSIKHNSFAYNFNYTIYNKLLEVKVGNKSIVKYNYNSNNGNLESISYGNGGFYRYHYDRYDRIILVTGAGYDVVSYEYNKKGLVTREHDYWLNQTTNYYYDCNGNLVSKTSETIDSEGSVKLVQNISLDENGNTVEQTNINNRYKTIKRGTDDNDDEFVEYISGDGNTPRNVKVSSKNDDFGRLDNVSTKFNGEELFYTEYGYETTSHKTTNNVSSILYDYDNTTKGLMYQYTYDANGNIATSVERSYDKGTGGVPINSSYSKSSYTYDNLNQLTQITDDSQKEKTKISYDNAGNIKKVQVYNSSTNALKKTNTYGYDTTWKDKLTSYNGETITYDAIGNPLKYRNGMTMQWKNGRQLSQVKTSKDTVTYKYNIKGLRTRKYNSDYTYYYYYDDNNNLIAMMQGGVVAYFYYDSNNSVTAMSINDTMYYYIKNLQGDITKIVNHQGKVMVEYTYDAWGNILKEKSNVTPSYATVKEFNPFRYRGYVYDTDTGLYYLQSRYYDPKTGRFINADDTAYVDTNSGTPLSTNMFAYCENNHINKTDPNGCYNIKNFNCYAYAFGINNRWMIPGLPDHCGELLPSYYTVDQIVKSVKKTFGKKVRKLKNKKSRIYKGEYRIAVRVCPYSFVPKDGHYGPYIKTFDFHFWKQDPRTLKWWNKHSYYSIQALGNANPDKTKCKGWLFSNKRFKFDYLNTRYRTTYSPMYYSSKTIYLAYKGRFWSK